jgi:hypothetical protein
MGRKHPESEIVADDGLHRVERISVSDAAYKASHPQGKRDDSAEQERMMELLDTAAHAATFEGAIGEAEKYWRIVRPVAPSRVPKKAANRPEPLSQAWYAAQVLPAIQRLRRVVASELDPNLEDWIVSALTLGARLEEAVWRFGLGDEVRLGLRIRKKNKESARVGVRTKAAERRVADDKLLQAVEGLQNRRPELSQRAVARFLLQRGGGPDDSRLTPEALSKRITRAKKRMTFRK